MNKLVTSLVMGACATLLAVAAPVASAQSNWENSTFTVTEPLDVGGFVLPPGTYLIKVVMLQSNRNTIQVTNTEQTKVFANVLCTPHLGYVERDNYEFAYGNAFDQIAAFASGAPINVRNPDLLEKTP